MNVAIPDPAPNARVVVGQIFARAHPGLARLAVAVEDTYAHGHALGLTHDECAEVVHAWEDWCAQGPEPMDWSKVRQAITRRALGDRWNP